MGKHLGEYFISFGIWGYLAVLLSILSILNAYSNITGNPISVFSIVPTWGWLTLLILGLVITPFLAFHKIKTKLDRYENAKPNMEMYGSPYVDSRTILSGTEIEGKYNVLGTPDFAHVKFCNNPQIRLTQVETTAKNVVAEISYFDNESKELLEEPIYGRWAGTKQPDTLLPFEPIRDLCQVDFESNGLPMELDISLKYREDENCYAFNNESYSFPNWKIPKFILKGDKFKVRVTLVGENVERREWWFMLYNEGKGKGMRMDTVK